MRTIVTVLIAAFGMASAAPAQTTAAQTAPTSQGGLGSLGGIGGLLGGALPNVGATGAGNAAGVLGYCVKNKLLGSTGAASVLGQLSGKPGVATSNGYAAGQNGVLQAGKGRAFSLDGVKSGIRTRVCDLVLNHAKSFL